MTQLESIITRYTELRAIGASAQQAIHELKPEIESLTAAARHELSQVLRAIEAEAAAQPPHTPAFVDQDATVPIREVLWINCPNCGRSNQAHEIICYACGNLLRPGGTNATRTLAETNNLEHSDDYFGEQSLLILQPRHSQTRFEVPAPPQGVEVIVGRSTPNSPMMPDVDLREIHAEQFGVSRLHLSLACDTRHNTLNAVDMDSANGTYINGQRLHPHELRVLRHGDELRMGKLIMTVLFQHGLNH